MIPLYYHIFYGVPPKVL